MTVFGLVGIGMVVGVLAGAIVASVSKWLPLSLQRQWRIDAHEFLELPYEPSPSVEFKSQLRDLKSLRFLIIEVLCVFVGALLFVSLGLSFETVVYSVLFFALIIIAVIDFETMYIPDLITMPLLWAGILFYALTAPDQLQWHILGAAAGYASLRWLPVGQGDAKLCAVAGAWVGLEQLLNFFMIGAPLGVLVGGVYYFLRGKSAPCPYGPSLVTALLATVMMQLVSR